MRIQMKKVEKMLDNTCPAWYFNTGIAVYAERFFFVLIVEVPFDIWQRSLKK